MITLTCPSCAGKSSVGDEFAGRKIKCPKCGTRVRHQPDGTFELLSVGQAPPSSAPPSAAATEGKPSAVSPAADTEGRSSAPPAATASAPADGALELKPLPAPPAPPGPPKKESTVAIGVVTEVAGKLLTQGESRQNAYVAWGVVGFIAVALSVVGLVMGDLILGVAPVAVALAAAFVWLFVRAQKRKAIEARERAAKPVKAAVKDEGKTEPLPKL